MHDEDAVLTDLGWGPDFAAAFEDLALEGAIPGRIARVDRSAMTVLAESGEVRAAVAAQIAHDPDPLRAPTVGDWVVLQAGSIVGVLPRRSAIVRSSAAGDDKAQVLAANVDKVFVVCSLEGRFRPSRLERLLVLAWQSGASPVAILTKADIAGDLEAAVGAAERLIGAGDVVAVSSLTGAGLDEVGGFLEPGATVVLLGPSGAGKSTLANRLGLGTVDHDGRGPRRRQGPPHDYGPAARPPTGRGDAHRHAGPSRPCAVGRGPVDRGRIRGDRRIGGGVPFL